MLKHLWEKNYYLAKDCLENDGKMFAKGSYLVYLNLNLRTLQLFSTDVFKVEQITSYTSC